MCIYIFFFDIPFIHMSSLILGGQNRDVIEATTQDGMQLFDPDYKRRNNPLFSYKLMLLV